MNDEEIKQMILKQCCEFNVDDNRLNKAVSTYGSIDIDELSKVIADFKKVPTLDEVIKENIKLKEVIEEIREYIKKEIGEIQNHQYATGSRRLNKILQILDKYKN